jgi:hypothetical protein
MPLSGFTGLRSAWPLALAFLCMHVERRAAESTGDARIWLFGYFKVWLFGTITHQLPNHQITT